MMKFSQRLSILSLVLLAASMAVPSYGLEFPKTTDRGSPGRSVGLGSRGDLCVDSHQQPSLTALLPHNSLATTFAADPNIESALFFYMPESSATGAELVIEDVRGEEVYRQFVALPEMPGIIQVTLPKTQASGAPLLAADELYYWDFIVACGDDDPLGESVLVRGGLQRIAPEAELLEQLTAVVDNPIAQAEIYAAQRAWQETLVLAAQVRDENPQVWRSLLQSVELEAVADMPLVAVTELN